MVTSKRHSVIARKCIKVKLQQKQSRCCDEQWFAHQRALLRISGRVNGKKRQSHRCCLFSQKKTISGSGASIDVGAEAKQGWDSQCAESCHRGCLNQGSGGLLCSDAF